MFIYQCYFDYDDGYSFTKVKEIIVSNKSMTLKEIIEFLYKTKYKGINDFIENLCVDLVDSIIESTLL